MWCGDMVVGLHGVGAMMWGCMVTIAWVVVMCAMEMVSIDIRSYNRYIFAVKKFECYCLFSPCISMVDA